MTKANKPTRRDALAGLALAPSLVAAANSSASAQTISTVLPDRVCVLTPQAVEGPYYFDPGLVRSDITEGRPGIPLRLVVQVLDSAGCTPIRDARVDLWHADAVGVYSGYDRQSDSRDLSTKGETFLRGTQMTDASGEVEFRTIYPGWYQGRTPHAHFEIFLDTKNVLTGQLYFPDALTEFIYTNAAPYNTRGRTRDTRNVNDGVLRESGGGHETFLNIKEEKDHYLGSLVIAVDRMGHGNSLKGPSGPPPGGPPPGSRPPEGPPNSTPSGSLIPGLDQTKNETVK